MDVWLGLAFIVGLSSTLHCMGMCGGIAGTLTYCLPQEIRDDKRALLPYLLAYGGGRVTSYAVAGALAGSLGLLGVSVAGGEWGHTALRLLSAAVLITMGLNLAGWLPLLSALERLGAPLWRVVGGWGRRMLPVRSLRQALLFGVAWGWLPCGMVYGALVVAAGSGDTLKGALIMLAFGAGTLPGTLASGLLTGWLLRFGPRPNLRRAIGVTIIALTAIGLAVAPPEQLFPHGE